MAKGLLALHPAATQHRCWLVRAECLSLALGKSLAHREGLFCRSHSILPRYQNSHLFPLCQFSCSHHVKNEQTRLPDRFPPPPWGTQRHRIATAAHPAGHLASPTTLAGGQGSKFLTFSPQPLWEPAVKSPQAGAAGRNRWLPKYHPAPG